MGPSTALSPWNGDGIYTLSGLKLVDGMNIDLRLTGTQNIGEGVYLSVSLNFTVNETAVEVVTDTASITERKVDATQIARTETAVTITTVQKNNRE